MKEKECREDKNRTDIAADEISGAKAKHAKATLKRFVRDLMTQKWKLLAVFLCLAVSAACTLASPALIGSAIDHIADGIKHAVSSGTTFTIRLTTMGGIALSLLAVYLLGSLFSYFTQHILAGVSQKLALSMRKRVSGKLNRLPLKYFDTHKKGDILSRVTSDMERIADTLQEALAQLFTSVITIVGAFIMMLLISPSLTLIAFCTILASIVAAALVSGKTNRYYAANQAALGKLNANIEEAFTGNNVIKAFNLQESMVKTNDELNETLRKTSTKAQFITYAINPVIRLMGQVGYVVIAVRGALSVISGTISIGDIQAVFQYVGQISEPVTELSYTMNTLQGAVAAAERVYDILDEPEETPDSVNTVMLPQPKGDVSFEHARFGYSDDKILMQDIDIHVKAGSKVAVVGPTGAGKTTLVNLLMRFYELQGGKITIDGVDIKEMSRKELRSILGMVLQDTWLFNGTVAENIAYGRGEATMEEIRRAAKAARVDYFIRTLPQGYDTVMDDELIGVSVGQKQLLTIARAILADPAILILDEATSSVDTRTETQIQKAMDNLMKGRTSFVIAHRLSTIKDSDLILVMRDGTIVEQGSHEQLLALGSFYAELYNSQFAAKAS